VSVVADAPPALHFRYAKRLPLHMSYPAMVDHVVYYVSQLPAGEVELVVDATGVGRPVVDMFVRAGLEPIAITITGGMVPTNDGREWRVPKRDLISTMKVVMQSKRLQAAETLPDRPVLMQELLNFQRRTTDAAHETYNAREGSYDDYVLACAIAVWRAEQQRQQVIEPLEKEIAESLRTYRGI
jgi:hypothetical protein